MVKCADIIDKNIFHYLYMYITSLSAYAGNISNLESHHKKKFEIFKA